MSDIIFSLTVPLPPPLNSMYRPNFRSRGVRKTVECERWETEVQWLAKVAKADSICIKKPQPVEMQLRIFYKTERDIDSSSKALLDCLQGIVYDDDKQIIRLVIEKYKDNSSPRVEIHVSASPPL